MKILPYGAPRKVRAESKAKSDSLKPTALPILTIAAAVLAILSIAVFTLENRKNISWNNREYLLDNTSQMAVLVDDS